MSHQIFQRGGKKAKGPFYDMGQAHESDIQARQEQEQARRQRLEEAEESSSSLMSLANKDEGIPRHYEDSSQHGSLPGRPTRLSRTCRIRSRI